MTGSAGLLAVGPDTDRRSRFEALYRRDARAILGFALRRTKRPEDAADVLSDVMLTAWRKLDSVPGEDRQARLWLYGVAQRVLANQRRSSARRTALGDLLRRELVAQHDRGHAEAVESHDILTRGLGQMSKEDREVLLLAGWEGLSPAEIATVLSLNGATVRSRLHRARRRLRDHLETEDR
jgi:RNA polymerase sigma factor (sigma-70 family)